MDQSTCCLARCERPRYASFLCQRHYGRLRRLGTTEAPTKTKRRCKMPKCDAPARKLGWCSTHHSRIKRNGSPFDKDQAWTVVEHLHCLVCARPVPPGIGFRRYCSHSCAAIFHRRKGGKSRPLVRECVQCGCAIDLTETSPTGRLRYSNKATCDNCRPPYNLRSFVAKLRSRDGDNCGICGGLIDFNRAYPDPESRSVDHIVPRSLGGVDEMSNYQLAHLACNIHKGNRTEGRVLHK